MEEVTDNSDYLAKCLVLLSQSTLTYISSVSGAVIFLTVREDLVTVFGIEVSPAYLTLFFYTVTILFGYQILRLSALIDQSFDNASQSSNSSNILRTHPAFLNVFLEVKGKWQSVINLTPCILFALACLIPFIGGTVSFFVYIMPFFLVADQWPSVSIMTYYLACNGLLALGGFYFLLATKRLFVVIGKVASSEKVAAKKKLAISLTAFLGVMPFAVLSQFYYYRLT